MTDKRLSHGLLAHTAPPHPGLEPLQGEAETDVAVIGGGYTGLSAALHLAKAGVDALLLEAREIGFGGAGRNAGLVNAGLWLMPEDVIKALGSDYGERLLKALGDSPDLVYSLVSEHDIECEAVRKGTLHCAHSPAGYRALAKREEQWLARKAPVSLLSRDDAAAMIGSRAFYGALWDKRAGTIQPLAYAYGLARAAMAAGARLYIGSPVTKLEHGADGWRLSTPGGMVRAKTVILAVHGYCDYAFGEKINALVPFNFFQFATAPLPEKARETILPGGQGAWDTNLILSSFRMDQAGRLIVGSVGQVENNGFNLHQSWARRTINKVFPQIGPIELEHAWNGRIAMTVDHIPRFHILGPDFVTVTSYNGRGIGPGSVFGKLLAKYMLDGSEKDIPLPVSKPKNVPARGMRGLFYEAGARIYHFLQGRILP